MKQETIDAVKRMIESGGLMILEEIADEVKRSLETPRYEGNAEKLVYETGKIEGMESGIEMLIETIKSYSNV